MQFKAWYGVVIILLVVSVISVITNPSYERSIEAKYYYYTGEYKLAQTLAKEAFAMDPYNRMAATMMTQSKVSLDFVNYINTAKKYQGQINEMADGDSISKASRAKIKLMCEIMIESYIKISSTVVIDDVLVEDAQKYHDEFKALYEKVTPKL
jgi:Tfp pilus assembly protein PilE